MAPFDYIEVFYNQRRRHSTIGYVSPAVFERRVRILREPGASDDTAASAEILQPHPMDDRRSGAIL